MAWTARFEDALVYATQLHAKHRRKGSGMPYVGHLLGVAAIAIDHGADEDQAIAALLHDAVEDCGGAATLAEIRERFGAEVAEIVTGCSDTDQTPKPPWLERKQRYVAHLGEASPAVLLISSSDKLHNAQCLLRDYQRHGDAIWSRFRGGKAGTLWYYRAVTDAYRAAGGTPVLDELERVVTALEQAVTAADA